MSLFSILLTVLGLSLFEIISSVDNAIINAEVLSKMGEKAKRFFLTWGILIAVFLLRGLLPWALVWASIPNLGPIGALTASFSNDPEVIRAIEHSSPVLLAGGGIFLILLFFHWLFVEPKQFGLIGERFFSRQGVWFFAVASIILLFLVWISVQTNPFLAIGCVVGSTIFFIINGIREFSEKVEQNMVNQKNRMSDVSKLLYLEVIDATFSIDGVVGAFAFTLSVPLIIIGNGLGALVLRQLTVSHIDRIKKYKYLKNGAMYSIFFLGVIMLLDAYGHPIPQWFSPIVTFITVGYFFWRSRIELKKLLRDIEPA